MRPRFSVCRHDGVAPSRKRSRESSRIHSNIFAYGALARCARGPRRDRPPRQLRRGGGGARPRAVRDHVHGAPARGRPRRAAVRPARASRAVHPRRPRAARRRPRTARGGRGSSSSASGAWRPDGSRSCGSPSTRRSRSRACSRWSRRSTRIARPSAPRTRSCGSGAKCWAGHGTRWPKDARTSCSAPPAIRPRAAATATACWPRSRACSPSRRRIRWRAAPEPLSKR